MVDRRVALELLEQVAFVVLELAFFDCVGGVVAELNHLCQATDLRWSVYDVKAFSIAQSLLEKTIKGYSHDFLELAEPVFDFCVNLHRLAESNVLSLGADH